MGVRIYDINLKGNNSFIYKLYKDDEHFDLHNFFMEFCGIDTHLIKEIEGYSLILDNNDLIKIKNYGKYVNSKFDNFILALKNHIFKHNLKKLTIEQF